jgi:TolB-like protein/DNA-binding winged helix-turn-helix (wHTH) protein/Flp pilus assembly protein TadD
MKTYEFFVRMGKVGELKNLAELNYNEAPCPYSDIGESFLNTRPKSSPRVRFADFEFDCHTGDLRSDGTSLKLQPQPAKVLAVLIQRAGEIVSRQELADEVWGSDTFVDFEQGLNYTIRQIRTVLKDDAERPRFVETIPKRGYRFIAPLKKEVSATEAPGPTVAPESIEVERKTLRRAGIGLIVAGIIAAALVAGFRLRGRGPRETATHVIGSLAVLPLQNLSGDPEQEYFSDGMTEELITDLAKLGSLRVISRTSVERYKNTKRPLPEIADELGVDAIVEGAVLRSHDRVRITAQLIDARSDHHLWADTYESDLRDLLSLQDEVAQRIATQVGIKVGTDQQARASNARQVDPEAYEAYLKGNFYWNRSNCDGSRRGLLHYQDAVSKDPSFAAAYAGLAQAYFTLGDWNCLLYQGAFSKSKAAALKALELDPTLGPAHAMLATLAYFYEWDWGNADREYRQAVQLNPNYAPAHILYAVYLVSMARDEQGLAEMRKALSLDPTAEFTNMVAVHILYLARRYDAAIQQARNSLLFYPDSYGTYFWLGVAYERKGMYDQAFDAYLRSKLLQGAKPRDLVALRRTYQKSGIRGYWQQLGTIEPHDESEACSMALIYARLGDTERIMNYLNWAFENHCAGIRTLKVDSFYDNIREDPRFGDLMIRMRLGPDRALAAAR